MFERAKTRIIEGKIRLQEAQTDLDNLNSIRPVTESNNYVTPEADEADWRLLGSNSEKGLDSTDQESLREQAIKTYYKDSHGRNIIRLFEKYVAGHGFKIDPMSTVPAVKEYWDEFWKVNKMSLRAKEIVRRSMRDGETFLRYFEGDNKETMLKVRFMNPALVTDPEKRLDNTDTKVSDGIETNPEDIEEVLGYYYKNDYIKAEEVQHIKILVDSDVLRGRSYYEPMLQSLAMYKKWLTDRMKLNEIRNTVALIKKVNGNPTNAANVATKYETSRKMSPDGNPLARAPKNVSVYTVNKNVDYELKSPNLQAADVQYDGRALLLNIAAGAGLPEFMISSDASNSNYASTVTAEGPAVMEFEDWQDFFGEAYKMMFERVIADGIAKGKIPKKETYTEREVQPDKSIKEIKITEPTSTECSITFPDLVTRDIEKETKAYVLQTNAGWMSKTTAQGRLDLDHEQERDLMAKEAEEDPEEEFKKDEEDLEIEKQKKAMADDEEAEDDEGEE